MGFSDSDFIDNLQHAYVIVNLCNFCQCEKIVNSDVQTAGYRIFTIRKHVNFNEPPPLLGHHIFMVPYVTNRFNHQNYGYFQYLNLYFPFRMEIFLKFCKFKVTFKLFTENMLGFSFWNLTSFEEWSLENN